MMRLIGYSRVTRWAARAMAASTAAPSPTSCTKHTFRGAASQTTGASGAVATRPCVGHGGQRLPVDHDRLGRVLRLVHGIGKHRRYRVANELGAVAGQHPVGWLEVGGPGRGLAPHPRGESAELTDIQILAGQHKAHAGQGCGRGDVDRPNAGGGMRRSDNHHVAVVARRQVGRVPSQSAQQPSVLGSGQGFADEADRRRNMRNRMIHGGDLLSLAGLTR